MSFSWGKSNPGAGPAHPRGPFSISSSYSNTICIFQSSQNGSAMPKSRNPYDLLCQMRQGAPLEILPTRRIRLRSRIVTPNAFSDKLFFLRRKWMSAFYYGTQMNCPDLSAAGAAQRPLKTGNRRITHYYCTKSDFSGPPKKSIVRSFGAGKPLVERFGRKLTPLARRGRLKSRIPSLTLKQNRECHVFIIGKGGPDLNFFLGKTQFCEKLPGEFNCQNQFGRHIVSPNQFSMIFYSTPTLRH